MENENDLKVSKIYLFSVLLLMLILPVISIAIDYGHQKEPDLILLTGKWFVFWAIGLRLFTAGIRQVIKPAFTAQDIFHIEDKGSFVVVRELGFANLCFGLIAIISLFLPDWRPAAAFAGGLYLGIAGINHIIKKPSGPNEIVAMLSDLFIFLILAVYLAGYYW